MDTTPGLNVTINQAIDRAEREADSAVRQSERARALTTEAGRTGKAVDFRRDGSSWAIGPGWRREGEVELERMESAAMAPEVKKTASEHLLKSVGIQTSGRSFGAGPAGPLRRAPSDAPEEEAEAGPGPLRKMWRSIFDGSPMIWPHQLYRFTNCCDWLLLLLAFGIALLAGLCLPAILWLYSGTLEQVGAAMTGGFDASQMSEKALQMVYCGVVYGLLTATYATLCELSKAPSPPGPWPGPRPLAPTPRLRGALAGAADGAVQEEVPPRHPAAGDWLVRHLDARGALHSLRRGDARRRGGRRLQDDDARGRVLHPLRFHPARPQLRLGHLRRRLCGGADPWRRRHHRNRGRADGDAQRPDGHGGGRRDRVRGLLVDANGSRARARALPSSAPPALTRLRSPSQVAAFGLERVAAERYERKVKVAERYGVRFVWQASLAVSVAIASVIIMCMAGEIYGGVVVAAEQKRSEFEYGVNMGWEQVYDANSLVDGLRPHPSPPPHHGGIEGGIEDMRSSWERFRDGMQDNLFHDATWFMDRVGVPTVEYKYCTYNCGDQYNMLYLDIQSVMSLMLGHELPYAARAREATFEWGPPPEFHGPIDQLGARRSPLAADRASLVSPFASLGQAPARRPPSRTAGPPTSSPSSSPARRRATSRRT